MVETLLGVQITASLFAIFMVYVSFLHFKKNNITGFEFCFWFLLWLVFLYFTFYPRVLDPILAKLFIIRAMDLLMIVSFMILAYLGFQNHIGIKVLQREHEKLVRKLAIKNVKKIKK